MNRAEVEKLTDELFNLVEEAQGHAFFSDGETFETTAEFFERVRGRLKWNDVASKVIRSFLRKHKQLSGPPRERQ